MKIRVPEGALIDSEIHNTILGSPLVLHDFYSRPGDAKDNVVIPYDDINLWPSADDKGF